jgi:hypothetical protein
MLFTLFNAFILLTGCIALYCGYVHLRYDGQDYLGLDDELWVILGMFTGSIFCAYMIVWGLASSVISFFAVIKAGASSLVALLLHH